MQLTQRDRECVFWVVVAVCLFVLAEISLWLALQVW